jgi:hypothetical protein
MAVTQILEDALSTWETRDEEEVKKIGWIKLSIRSEKKKKRRNYILPEKSGNSSQCR